MLKTGAAVLAASAACSFYWSYPSYQVKNNAGKPHDRLFGQQENDYIRCVGSQLYGERGSREILPTTHLAFSILVIHQ
jgi:hypothetical protein